MSPHQDPRIAKAATILAEYVRTGRNRTGCLVDAAEIIVSLRQSHTLTDGRTDLGGRSGAYRAAMRAMYDAAGITDEDEDRVQTALRYHISTRLHRLYPADVLKAAGLGEISQRERLAQDRQAAAHLLSALKDPGLLAESIAAQTALLDGSALSALPAKQARDARQSLLNAAAAISAAVAAIDARRPRKSPRAASTDSSGTEATQVA